MELFLSIAITHFIALLTPGADFFLILKTLMQSQKRATRFTCAGIALGNAIILISIYLSLFIIGQVNTELFILMKWLGVVYFAYLAFQCFRLAQSAQRVNQLAEQRIDQPQKHAYLKAFLSGLFSSLFNPKNLMFYSVLVILIYPQYSFVQNALLCFWMVGLVLIWNLAIVQLIGSSIYLSWLNRHLRHLYYLAGFSFLLFMLVLLMY
ncbi:amino acid transporter [Acinetobacter proteolyticus]|uniref:LysE family translocator n=1 Tax=Acinetobacter proteolyticus TaxID=1776741 RepID=UPI0008631719|nr:LysE family translocator [Acinetobacter proteolyticus]OEY95378.1 amino acid transporter [Acinetobacter proteolyticus]